MKPTTEGRKERGEEREKERKGGMEKRKEGRKKRGRGKDRWEREKKVGGREGPWQRTKSIFTYAKWRRIVPTSHSSWHAGNMRVPLKQRKKEKKKKKPLASRKQEGTEKQAKWKE